MIIEDKIRDKIRDKIIDKTSDKTDKKIQAENLYKKNLYEEDLNIDRPDKDLAFMMKYENIAWYEDGAVKILDRRVYPQKIEFVTCVDYMEVKQAITDMVTQSAGPYTAAGMGMALAAFQIKDKKKDEQIAFLEKAALEISNARPTTANRMFQITSGCLKEAKDALAQDKSPVAAIFNGTVNSLNRRYNTIWEVAKRLVSLFPKKGKVMTQCFGETIVAFMGKEVKNQNKDIEFFVPETRPYLQGSRLTASVLQDQGLNVTVLTDNMAAWTIKEKKIDVFTSAADSICMDGHIVNKVGTFQLAILSKYFKIPYYVTGIPDRDKISVEDITIEERNPEDVLSFMGNRISMDGVKGYYPSFDITPPHLVSGVVTDKGIFVPYNLEEYFKTKTKNFY